MDSDGTHNPKYIKVFLKKISKYDLITTSRFKNKKSLKAWPLFRIVLTNIRHFIIRFFLGLTIDASGAFRCYNIDNFKSKDLLDAKDNDYSFFGKVFFILYKRKYLINIFQYLYHTEVLDHQK